VQTFWMGLGHVLSYPINSREIEFLGLWFYTSLECLWWPIAFRNFKFVDAHSFIDYKWIELIFVGYGHGTWATSIEDATCWEV
jgi:hypothetical protein